MFLMTAMKFLLIATGLAVIWGFLSSGQIPMSLAIACIVIISLLTA